MADATRSRLAGNLPDGFVRYLLLAVVVTIGITTTGWAISISARNATADAQAAFDQEAAFHVLVTTNRIAMTLA